MIIKYIKEKQKRDGSFIPIGKLVDCTNEYGKSEIQNGFAVMGNANSFDLLQKERFVKAESEQEEILTKKHKK